MEEDIELIIVVNSRRVIGEKQLREASQSLVKIEVDFFSRRNNFVRYCVKGKLWRKGKS